MDSKRKHLKDDEVLEYLRKLPETKLHTEIIIPLFKKMGFTHIRYLHGASERGKDILYVVEDVYGDSRLAVCQVKNNPFSGRANVTANTIAVLNQLKQCRNTEVLNPKTHIKELPQEVLLLTSYPVPDKDTADAGRLLDDLRALGCKIIGPEKFVSLIREKMPEIYNILAFPGFGLMKALCAYVSVHREASAFGITRKRTLADFYVDLGFIILTELDDYDISEELIRVSKTKLSLRGKTYRFTKDDTLQIHRLLNNYIKNWLSVLPLEL